MGEWVVPRLESGLDRYSSVLVNWNRKLETGPVPMEDAKPVQAVLNSFVHPYLLVIFLLDSDPKKKNFPLGYYNLPMLYMQNLYSHQNKP